jgi:putative mRNA 3-end processing factor
MLDGGPVLEYIRQLKDDPRNAILLTGYQVEGTNGRMLMDTGSIDLNGEIEKISCEVQHFDFSAHAGHDELLEFAEKTGAEEVVLVHGDNRDELASDMASFAKVHMPTVETSMDF